jgi:hypothetical protein
MVYTLNLGFSDDSHASSSLACSKGKWRMPNGFRKYGKEIPIRRRYRGRGGRRILVQRRRYWERRDREGSGVEETLVSKGREERSGRIGRSGRRTRRRGRRLRRRTRGPGRFPQEFRKRVVIGRRGWRRRTLGGYTWYHSEVERNGRDRRRGRSLRRPRRWMDRRRMTTGTPRTRLMDRKRRWWTGVVRYRRRISERTERGNRRSRRGSLIGYRRWVEIWIRRSYRKTGRKRRS